MGRDRYEPYKVDEKGFNDASQAHSNRARYTHNNNRMGTDRHSPGDAEGHDRSDKSSSVE